MWSLTLLIFTLILGLGAFFGAPYVPTHRRSIIQALALLNLKPGELLLDLGSGDGRLLAAAGRRGWRAIGYEINPFWWAVSRLATWRWRDRVSVKMTDYTQADWPAQTKAVYIFGSKLALSRVARKIQNWPKPLRVVSYGFTLPGYKSQRQEEGFWLYEITPRA